MSSKPTLVVVPSELAGALGWTETGLALGTEGDDCDWSYVPAVWE